MVRSTVSYKSNGTSISTELFQPAGGHNGGLIIIAYGSDGLVNNPNGSWKSMIEGYAVDLADQGFVAAIPNYFDKTGTSAGDLDPSKPLEYAEKIALNRGAWLESLQHAITELAQPRVVAGIDASRIGLLGFSLGAHLCARLAGRAKAAVLFFAPYMDGLDLSGALSLHVEIHHGAKDFLPYSSNAALIHQQLATHGAKSILWPAYPEAVHGFVGDDPGNTNARQLSHKRTLDFYTARI